MCNESVLEILKVLEDFITVSGLEVNKGKTQLMVTGGGKLEGRGEFRRDNDCGYGNPIRY